MVDDKRLKQIGDIMYEIGRVWVVNPHLTLAELLMDNTTIELKSDDKKLLKEVQELKI
jgi:hypothetical protein